MSSPSQTAAPSLSHRPDAVLDPFGGVAGDMLLGALVDLGADLEQIRQGLAGLEIEPWRMEPERVTRRHLAGLRVHVSCQDSANHRHLSDVLRILRQAKLPATVLAGAEHTFQLLAQAEGLAHGIDASRVHFHEVGAADAILDICAVHYAMHLLDMRSFWVTPLPSGSGTVHCAHGELPCPVPATLRLLENFDLVVGQGEGEMVTPTGAALVASLGRPLRGSAGVRRLGQVGYGAGTRNNSLCRVWRLDKGASGTDEIMQAAGLGKEEILSLSCELDDSTPQQLAYLCETLMDKGALDARLVPTQMKKGRAGQSLELLVRDDAKQLDALVRVLIQDSRTLGFRFQKELRYVAPRELHEVQTDWGAVKVKIADFGWHRRAYPEYEDCAKLAREHQVPLSKIQAAAMLAWERKA